MFKISDLRAHLVLKSSNVKVGPIPASTSTAHTCPDVCPFKSTNSGGCYAEYGPQAIHWRKVTEGQRGSDWATFCADVAAIKPGQLWRHNVSGDLPGNGQQIDRQALTQLTQANEGRRGFTYTHYDATDRHNAEAIACANKAGFTINLSGNNTAHADELADLAIGPVVCVLPADQVANTTTPKGRRVVVCPAVTRDDVSCATCQLCQRVDRQTIVGFPAHGTGKKKAAQVVVTFHRKGA